MLESLGYLGTEDHEVTQDGWMLARLYSELDLVAAECIRAGVFDGLDAPQLAAVLSSLVYETRRTDNGRMARMPDRATEVAQGELRRTWRQVSLVERDHRLERGPEPDIGFAEAAFDWASGMPLADVLWWSSTRTRTEPTANRAWAVRVWSRRLATVPPSAPWRSRSRTKWRPTWPVALPPCWTTWLRLPSWLPRRWTTSVPPPPGPA